ncbi:hypothetical protein [Natrinema ejinorense]|uniref:Uncharacterized protein n=1 Tax=Natrinema ejinorense TaxID=373386 RepID=A0A2A5QX63_9EURY|nr:hypothetical protein [Natrinema ejinorense]PCR91420.1 hypothetical protein CP557_13330 [Natrinema ejinorense]
MPQCPRRTLLGSIGTTMTIALAGSTVGATQTDDQSDGSSESPALDTLLEYLPASIASDSLAVTTIDFEERRVANEPYEPRPNTGGFGIDRESVSKQALVYSTGDDYSRPITVLAGDFDLESEGETRETDGGVEYERHENDREQIAAVTDDIVVLAEDDETITDAFAASAGDSERLLEAKPVIDEGFSVFDDADAGYSVHIGDDFHLPSTNEEVAVEYAVRAMSVLGPDTMEMKLAISFEDESVVTDELVESLTGELSYMATDDPTVEVDGELVTVVTERDLAAERAVREHESPGSLRVERDVDLDDDVLEIEVGRGDPTPIEDLTLKVDDEEYDREIWTNGHGTLEEGDTIVIDMDDVEPNLSITLEHDHELGSSSSGTHVLSHFKFEFDYDVDAGTLAVEYADDFPLDGDEVSIAVYGEQPPYRHDEEGPEPRTTVQPWTGETMSTGDEATVDDVEPGDIVLVCWDGTSHEDSIGYFRARPPGNVRFDYEFESKTLSATLKFEDDAERPADEYELLIDEEPADTQWADESDTVSSGSTIEIDDVQVGTDVTVVWGDDDIQMGWTSPRPQIELEFAEDGTAIEHVGGDSLPASELTLHVRAKDDFGEIDVGEKIDGEFEEGDTISVDMDDIRYATLQYGDTRSIGYVHSRD